jgi:hypothetical protein
MSGVNLVTAFRRAVIMVAPSSAPADVIGFTSPVVAAGGYTMPATSTTWPSGSRQRV